MSTTVNTSEAGHPVCGDKVYVKKFGADVFEDKSGAPRLALHATELGFEHPASGAHLHWTMPLPGDLARRPGNHEACTSFRSRAVNLGS